MTSYHPMLLCDFYKIAHREQYPQNTQFIYSTWTPRMSRIVGVDKVVAFGFQAFIKQYLVDYFNECFFKRPIEQITEEYKRIIKNTLGIENPATQHIEDLHELGFLPILIKAVKEGTLVPIRCPMLTIENTNEKFFWLTNYLETLMSNYLWMPTTSATISLEYKKILTFFALKTVGNADFVPFQGHDFSMRGMASLDASCTSGAGHLTSFVGTDTVPAIMFLEKYYHANVEKELVGCSIPASEHSVACANGLDELSTLKRFLTEIYPKGFVSFVSDTWDFFKVITEVLPALKDIIMAREGKLVIRPDSGDPVKIVCGDPEGKTIAERKGAIELLWEIFGGTVSKQGYKILDSHIGCIYGDAITLDRCREICTKLALKGFASTNMVYGIGSYTYQYNTRDTFGFALKSTHAVIDGQSIDLFKDPKTDSGMKKSQKGRVVVYNPGDQIVWKDEMGTFGRRENDLLQPIFHNGYVPNKQSLSEIRKHIQEQL